MEDALEHQHSLAAVSPIEGNFSQEDIDPLDARAFLRRSLPLAGRIVPAPVKSEVGLFRDLVADFKLVHILILADHLSLEFLELLLQMAGHLSVGIIAS